MMTRGFKTRAENMSLQIRRELGLQKRDPLACEALAKHLSVLLLKPINIVGLSPQSRSLLLGKARDSWSAVTVFFNGVDVVVYNSSHSKVRQSSDIMHELSHILLSHEPSKIILTPKIGIALRDFNDDQEDEAGWLAGCLLLPREALLYIKNTGLGNSEAQQMYQVSANLLKYRLNISGVNYQISRRNI